MPIIGLGYIELFIVLADGHTVYLPLVHNNFRIYNVVKADSLHVYEIEAYN